MKAMQNKNDSKIGMHGHTGAGVNCQELAHYIPTSAVATAFERGQSS